MSVTSNNRNKMKMLERQLSVVLILLCCVQFHVQSSQDEVGATIHKSQFPKEFLFGTSTSSYQIEGATFEDGRGLSNWDVFSHTPGKITNGDNADIADDHYHRYMEDIELMKTLGVNVYRFSISWTRILPRGIYGPVNPSGIEFYNRIIDNLVWRGIEPFVTIHHSEYPQELEGRYGGWMGRQLMEEDLLQLAKICFENFGDRVKYWITINEPNIFALLGYMMGTLAPGHCSPPFGKCYVGNSDVEPLIVMHNLLIAHAKVVQLYRTNFQAKQRGILGIAVHSFFYEPFRNEERHRQAVKRAFDFNVHWAIDPLVFGEYPAEMRSILGRNLPTFSPAEQRLIKGSLDFIGINHYGTLYAKACYPNSNCTDAESSRAISGYVKTTGIRDGIPIGNETGVPAFFVVPKGMEKVVEHFKQRYNNKLMYITENGYASLLNETKMSKLVHDADRARYLETYLKYLLKAIRNGANVKGYMIWSFIDNFEWASGYGTKFGIYYVDRNTQKRTPKRSARWYSTFLDGSLRTNITQDLSDHNPILEANM